MSKTRVLICGGRDASINQNIADMCIADVLDNYSDSDIEIVSGSAKGGDKLGETFANDHKHSLVQFPPDWKTYGRAAGPIRNQQMIDYISECDNPVVIAFWDGNSKGTRSTIKMAQTARIPVHIIRYNNSADSKVSINSGVQMNGDELIINWNEDDPEDILPLVNQTIVESRKHGHTFYYAFKANKQYSDWNKFLYNFKHYDVNELKKITDRVASRFIAKFNNFDCILYPKSSSELNNLMIESLHEIDPYIPAYPVSKMDPSDITFDWDAFNAKFKGDEEQYNKTVKSIERMMDRIHSSDKFSLQKQVIPRLRKFIRGFLSIGDFEIALDDIVNSQTILILDDIVTSGATTLELINMLDDIGYEGDIVVYSIVYNR